ARGPELLLLLAAEYAGRSRQRPKEADSSLTFPATLRAADLCCRSLLAGLPLNRRQAAGQAGVNWFVQQSGMLSGQEQAPLLQAKIPAQMSPGQHGRPR